MTRRKYDPGEGPEALLGAYEENRALAANNERLRREVDALQIERVNLRGELAEARVKREPLMKLLEYCAVSDDMQYGTVSTTLVRDLVLEATAADQPTGAAE